jgi:hypothetical protein
VGVSNGERGVAVAWRLKYGVAHFLERVSEFDVLGLRRPRCWSMSYWGRCSKGERCVR